MKTFRLETEQTVTTKRTYFIDAENVLDATAKFLTISKDERELDMDDEDEGSECINDIRETDKDGNDLPEEEV